MSGTGRRKGTGLGSCEYALRSRASGPFFQDRTCKAPPLFTLLGEEAITGMDEKEGSIGHIHRYGSLISGSEEKKALLVSLALPAVVTMVDLEKIKRSFVRMLSSRYHERVEYPSLVEEENIS